MYKPALFNWKYKVEVYGTFSGGTLNNFEYTPVFRRQRDSWVIVSLWVKDQPELPNKILSQKICQIYIHKGPLGSK